MKKHFFLPLALLLSFTSKLSSASAPAVVTPTNPSVPAQAAPSAQPAAPVVTDTQKPAPIPTVDDINNFSTLITQYREQLGVIRNLQAIVSADNPQTENLPTQESVRSLLKLLELHKKEADLIISLRSSIASLQATLGKWDNDIATLITKKRTPEEKPAQRSVDYEKVKDLVKKESRAQ